MTVPRPFTVLARLWLLVAVVQSAAVPTQDTLVVSKFEDTSDAILSDPRPTPVPSTEATTQEHTPPIKLTEMDVKSVITMRYAHTAVVAHVRNPAKRAQEANFRVLLPETAFISGFVMTIDGKSYKAYVKEKEEAKQIYQDAVSHGYGAAHIATKARDSNHFTVSVNVEPSSTAVFNLTYEELLARRNDVYNHAINLHPGSLVPKFTVTVEIKESANITELRVPEIRTGNEIDATKNDAQMSNVIVNKEGLSAVITFSPDLEEQKRLMHVYADKSKESANDEANGEGVLGQFVVQYDVDRSKDGQILVNDGYFVHFFAPENLPPMKKHVIFVLDTSGSMMGRKMDQLKQAMQTILGEMNPGDRFNIVDFDSTVSVHDLSEADKEPPKRNYYYDETQKELNLVAPSQATPENIEKARAIISRLEAYGGTNIASALSVAVDLINKHSGNSKLNANSTSTTTVTPTSDSTTEVTTKTENKPNSKHLEPIIIFLTDGDPTVGETNPKTIITHLSEKNYGQNKATIFSLAFGEDADRKFLRKLSLRNDGFMRHIYEAADAALQLRDFYRQVSSPLLADVKFVYPTDQVNEERITKHTFRTYYAGSELVVAGQMTNTAIDLESQVLGFCGVLDDDFHRKKYDTKVKVPVAVEKHQDLPLERLWAYVTIKQLLDQNDALDSPFSDKNNEENPEKKALALALQYGFVTPLTSLVVVKPNETKAVDAESVDKQGGFNSPYQHQALSIPSGAFGFAGAADPSAFYVPLSPNSADSFDRGNAFSAIQNFPQRPQVASFESFAEDLAVDDYDSDNGPVLTTPFIRPVVYHSTSTSTESVPLPSPGLHTYHMEDLSWIATLLNYTSDTIVFETNETITLKLTRDQQAPKAFSGDTSCNNAVAGGEGLCVYLTRCYEARNITVDIYKTNYCVVDDGYAGFCCHNTKIDLITVR